MKTVWKRLLRDESGASAIEYTLIASLLAVALLAAWPGFYSGFMTSWTNAGTVIANAVK
jgi:pilus assembly protein Flp/PilA